MSAGPCVELVNLAREYLLETFGGERFTSPTATEHFCDYARDHSQNEEKAGWAILKVLEEDVNGYRHYLVVGVEPDPLYKDPLYQLASAVPVRTLADLSRGYEEPIVNLHGENEPIEPIKAELRRRLEASAE